jgi:hypothetical protein
VSAASTKSFPIYSALKFRKTLAALSTYHLNYRAAAQQQDRAIFSDRWLTLI